MRFFRKYTFFSLSILFIILLSLGIGLYLDGLYKNILDKNINENNFTVAKKYKTIETYLLNTKQDLFFISKVYSKIKDVNTLSKTIEIFSSENPIYSQIRYIDNTGKETVRVENKNNKSIIIPSDKLQNKSNRYYFLKSKTLKKNEIYISLFDLNVENNKVEVPYNPTLRFSTPILSTNKTIDGYAIINYSGKKLLGMLKKDLGFNTTLLNQHSDYLLSTINPQNEWNFMFKKESGLKNTNIELWNKLESTKMERFNFLQDNNYYSVIKVNPLKIISLNQKEKNNREWFLISHFNKEKVVNEFLTSARTLLMPLISMIIVLLLASYILKHYLRRLEKANERIEISSSAFENSQEGLLVLNKDGNIVNINKGFTSITGYTYDEVYLKNPKMLRDDTHTVDEKFFENMWNSIHKNDFWSGELHNHRKNGQKFIEHLTVSTIKEKNKIKYYVGVFSDITDMVKQKEKIERTNQELVETLEHLKIAQDQLIESEKLSALGQLIAGIAHEINSPLGAIQTSSSNIFDALNKTLINKPKLNNMLDSDQRDLVSDLNNDILSNNSYITIKEQRQLKKDIRIKLDSYNIKDSRYLSDILSSFMLKDLEKYLPLLKHDSSKFIFNTVYDEFITISNLLNIQNSVQRASKTIFALKKFVHFDHERDGTIEKLENEIDNILILLEYNLKHNIEIIKDYSNLDPIYCYPDELGQVWMNLILNAVHAMNNKGTIKISTYEDKSYQVVSIQDSGCGIPDDIKEKIFKPFFTTKEAGVGSGLGLDIVLKVVNAHDGIIDLKSDNSGTIFYVKIPKRTSI